MIDTPSVGGGTLKCRGLALVVVIAAILPGGGRELHAEQPVSFRTDLPAALEDAAEQKKPVYLAFGAVWCPYCREMEKIVHGTRIEVFAEDFVWVLIDIDRQLTVAEEWGVEATPTILLLDSSGRPLRRLVGYTSAANLESILSEFLRDLTPQLPGEAPGSEVFARFTEIVRRPEGFRGKSICFSNVGYGPLSVRTQSPFQALRLGIAPRTPSTLARGGHQVRAVATWANVWGNDPGSFDPANGELGPFLVDFESLDLSLAYAYGLSDTFELEVEYDQRIRFGGAMDGFIEAFHDLFSIDQLGRDRWPRNQSVLFFDAEDGSPPVWLDDEFTGTFSRGLGVTMQNNLTCGSSSTPAIAWAATGRYALDGADRERGDIDLALTLAAAKRVGRFYFYLTLGYAWFGGEEVSGIALESTQASLLAAVEWRFNSRMSLVIQYLGSEPSVRDIEPFSEESHEVVLGWQWETRHNGVLEIGILENIFIHENSPDFGLHAAFTQRF